MAKSYQELMKDIKKPVVTPYSQIREQRKTSATPLPSRNNSSELVQPKNNSFNTSGSQAASVKSIPTTSGSIRSYADVMKEIKQPKKTYQEIKQKNTTNGPMSLIADAKQLPKVNPYQSYLDAPDFQTFTTAGAAISNPSFKEANKGIRIFGKSPFAEDIKNKVTFARENYGKVGLNGGVQDADVKYAKMTNDEVSVYNYLLSKNGETTADEFLKSIDRELNKRTMTDIAAATRNVSNENKAVGTILNVANNVLSPAATIKTGVNAIKNKATGETTPVDQNGPAFQSVVMQQAAAEGITQDMGEVGSFLTQTGLSMAQFATRLPFGAGIGAAISGASASSGTIKSVLDRGGSENQALLAGGISGAAELIFEKIGIDRLKAFKANPGANVSQVMKNVLRNAGAEGTEEVLTELTNSISDGLVMKDLSNYSLRVDELKAQGMTEEKAKKQGITEIAQNIGLAFAGGALAGGVFGAGANVMGITQQGAAIRDMGSTQALIEEGMQSAPGTQSLISATTLQGKQNRGQRVSAAELGMLQNANEVAISKEVQQEQENTQVQSPNIQNKVANEPGVNISPRPVQTSLKMEHNNTVDDVKQPTSMLFDSKVKVTSVHRITNGNVYVNTVDNTGDGISLLDDLTMQPTSARLYGESGSFQTEGAKAFVSNYNDTLDLDTYKKGFEHFYQAGKTGLSRDIANRTSAYSSMLDIDTKMSAYMAGQTDATGVIQEKQGRVLPGNQAGGFTTYENMSKLDENEAFVIHRLAQATGVRVVVDDEIAGANGYYSNGEIHLSKNADNKAMVVFSHELTHHMEDHSPELWKSYRDHVINFMKTDDMQSYTTAYDRIRSLYQKNGVSVDDDVVINELVANATETFLTDGNAIERIASKDRNLAQRIFDAIGDFVEVIKQHFAGYESNSRESKMLEKNIAALEEAKTLWFAALEDASGKTTTETANEPARFSKKEIKVGITESKNFLKWFGDWKTDAANASKVVNADGTPKIMYAGHANVALFGSTFDPKKATSGGLFFTDDANIASSYANTKLGIKESYEDGSGYRLLDENGEYTKTLKDIRLTPEQIELAEVYSENEASGRFSDYIEDNKRFDKQARMWDVTGAKRTLQGFYEYYYAMGDITMQPKKITTSNPTGYVNTTFEQLLNEIGVKWNSYEKPQGGVFPVYLNIKQPLITAQNVPADLMEQFELLATKEKEINDPYGGLKWTKDYPMKKWVNDIKVMQETGEETFWATQIPTKAAKAMKELGYDGIQDIGGKMGGTGHEVWIALESNQVKSATGNSGAFSKKKDIRLSLKDTSEVNLKTLHESANLTKVNELLETQLNEVKGYAVERSKVEKIARKLVKEYNSQYDIDTLTTNLEQLFSYVSDVEVKGYQDVIEVASSMAKNVLEQSVIKDTTLTNVYADLRKQLRTTSIKVSDEQKKEIAYHFGSYEAFRRSNFGKIKFTNDGIALDSLWVELSEQHPELFEADVNAMAQPMVLAEIFQMTEPFMEHDSGMNMDELSHDIALRLFDEYLKTPALTNNHIAQLRKLYADEIKQVEASIKVKYEKKLEKYKAKTRNEANERVHNRLEKQKNNLEEKTKEKLTTQKVKLTDKAAEKLEKQKAKFDDRIKRAKDTKKERESVKKYRGRIEKNVTELSKWLLHPTDAKHVPEHLKKYVGEFLSMLDLSSARLNAEGQATKKTVRWQEKLNALRHMLQEAETNPDTDMYLELDPELIARMDEFSTMNEDIESIHTMDSIALKELDYMVSTLKKSITESNKLRANERYQTIRDLGEHTIIELRSKKEKKPQARVVAMIDNLVSYEQMDSFSFADTLGDAGKSVIHALRLGQDKHTLNIKESVDYMQQLVDAKTVKTWTGSKAEIKTVIVAGKEIKASVAQLMELYVLNKRDQAKGHIKGGGVKFNDVKGVVNGKKETIRQVRPFILSETDVDRLTDLLTPEQRAVADGMQQFLSDNVAEWGNATSEELYGYKKFTEKNYYPIKSDDNYIQTNDQNAAGDNGQLYAIKNLGMTKGTKRNANNPLVIGDIFDTFTRHVNEMSTYNAFLLPLSDAMKWYNFKLKDSSEYLGSVKETLERVGGANAKNYFLTLVKAVNGVSNAGQDNEILGAMISNLKVASVGANLRVVAQQPSAYFRASYLVDTKYLLMGLSKKIDVDKMHNYAPISQWKAWGFFETDTGKSMKTIITGDESVLDELKEKSLYLAGKFDDITWGALFNAIEFETKATHPKLSYGSEEFYKEVGNRFRDVVDRTQVVDTVFHRSQMMRKKGLLTKTVTAFMSEPNKNYNMLRNSFMEVAQNNNKDNVKKAYRATVAFASSGIAAAVASALIDGLRDKEKEKPYKDKVVDASIDNIVDNLNPLGLLPIMNDIISIFQGYTPSRMEMSAISNIITAGTELLKYVQGDSKKNGYAVLSQFTKAASQAFGVPVGNVLREAEGVYNTFSKDGLNLKSDTASNAVAAENMVKALLEGNQADYDRIYQKIADRKRRDAIEDGKPLTEDKIKASIETSLKSALSEHSDIIAAASARLNNDLTTYKDIVTRFKSKGFQQDHVVSAVNNAMSELKPKEETVAKEKAPTLIYSYDDLQGAIDTGNLATLEEVRDYLVEHGKALDTQRSAMAERYKDLYLQALDQNDTETITYYDDVLIGYFGFEKEDLLDWIPGTSFEDMGSAIVSGDYDTLTTVRDTILNRGTKVAKVRSGITREVKPIYKEYYNNLEFDKLNQLRSDLINYLGYSAKDLDKWLK